MNPLIGITCSFSSWDFADSHMKGQAWFYTSRKYVDAVREAGGSPLVLPFQDPGVVEKIDGLLLSGGVDIDPHHFGEQPRGVGHIDPERDFFEMTLTRMARERGIPILGICRGMQMLCVACGGTLLQDIDSRCVKHMQDAPSWYGTHQVTLSGTLAGMMGAEKIAVNSFHHQAVRNVPDGFSVAAVAEDGIIEGMCAHEGAAVGVQWHPEWMTEKYPVQGNLFSALVERARDPSP